MITKEQALENVKKYLSERKRIFKSIEENVDRIFFDNSRTIPYPSSKYYEKERAIYTIIYYEDGYTGDQAYFVLVDAETGDVICTLTEHGYVEDWER